MLIFFVAPSPEFQAADVQHQVLDEETKEWLNELECSVSQISSYNIADARIMLNF